MTIHHDKLAYGKIAGTKEELTDEQILEMLSALCEDETEEKNTENGNGTDKEQ